MRRRKGQCIVWGELSKGVNVFCYEPLPTTNSTGEKIWAPARLSLGITVPEWENTGCLLPWRTKAKRDECRLSMNKRFKRGREPLLVAQNT
jgi:hypothetical protein